MLFICRGISRCFVTSQRRRTWTCAQRTHSLDSRRVNRCEEGDDDDDDGRCCNRESNPHVPVNEAQKDGLCTRSDSELEKKDGSEEEDDEDEEEETGENCRPPLPPHVQLSAANFTEVNYSPRVFLKPG